MVADRVGENSGYHRSILLGGAQLGLAYGITNKHFLSRAALYSLLDSAQYLGFLSWDLARAYGCAEARMAMWLRNRCDLGFSPALHFGTKVQPAQRSELHRDLQRSRSLLSQSRYFRPLPDGQRLRKENWQGSLEYVLLHSGKQEFLQILYELCPEEKIGISLYYPAELERLLAGIEKGLYPVIDVLQIPYSIADKRFKPYLSDLRRRGIALQLRSLYLQGILFYSGSDIAKLHSGYFAALAPLLYSLERLERQYPEIPRQDLLLYAGLLEQGSSARQGKIRLVIGVSRRAELLQLHRSLARISHWPAELRQEIAKRLDSLVFELPDKILVPALWPQHWT